jgi:asparagine synthase (glutamine-hydrolysing)
MTAAIAHRGPDDAGFFEDARPGVATALGHRRLSILDLSDRAHQPMVDGGTGACMVYNGEVFNFPEIRAELGESGFCSTGDTEVVLQAYARWGVDAFAKMRGMFAVAIWDPRHESLLLVRDSLGIKPLYYCTKRSSNGDSFWFGSEISAFLGSDEFPRKLSSVGLSGYLWNGFVPGPASILDGVELIPAGTVIRVRRDPASGRLLVSEPQRFRKCPTPPAHRVTREEIHAELAKAVEMRLVSDVPLGVFLSGGIDSSVITALAQRSAGQQVRTFTIGFDEARFDETHFATRVAERVGTNHNVVRLTKDAFASTWKEALASLDQPTFDGINTYFVSRAVRESGIKVALAGTGGDELFGGYTSFKELPRLLRLSASLGASPGALVKQVGRLVSRFKQGKPGEVRPQTRWGKLEDILKSRGDLPGLYQSSHALFTRALLGELNLNPAANLPHGVSERLEAELRESCHQTSALASIAELERIMFLRERLLRDSDCTSMRVGLELRVPLIDEQLVDMVAAMDDHDRFSPVGNKQVLRDAAGGMFEPDFFDRPKAGFELPLDVWCRELLHDEMDGLFRDINLCHRIGLNAETVSRTWRAFRAGAPGLYWSRVWGLFALLWWCRKNDVYA